MRITVMILVLLISLSSFAQESTGADSKRLFMFIGEPNSAAWKFLMENPVDRRAEVSEAMEKIGGKIMGYYFGLGDGKNYIIAELPDDNNVIQAVYLMRLPAGLLNSYQMIELMSSRDMSDALKKSKELIEIEKATGNSTDN